MYVILLAKVLLSSILTMIQFWPYIIKKYIGAVSVIFMELILIWSILLKDF